MDAIRQAFFVAAISITAGLCPSLAKADLALHTTRASFEAAAVPNIKIDFESEAVGPLCTPWNPYVPYPCVYWIGPVHFTATVGFPEYNQRPLLSIDAGFASTPSRGLISNGGALLPDEFFLEFGGSAIGLDIVTSSSGGDEVHAQLVSSTGVIHEFKVTAGSGAGAFLGVSGLQPDFWRLSLYSESNPLIDNLSVTTVTEPTSGVLILLGLLGVLRQSSRQSTGHRSAVAV